MFNVFLSIRKDNNKYYSGIQWYAWTLPYHVSLILQCWNTMKPQFEILNETFSRSLTFGTLSYSSSLSDIFKLVSIYGLLFVWDNEILKPNP